jgi:hypothetical protein
MVVQVKKGIYVQKWRLSHTNACLCSEFRIIAMVYS